MDVVEPPASLRGNSKDLLICYELSEFDPRMFIPASVIRSIVPPLLRVREMDELEDSTTKETHSTKPSWPSFLPNYPSYDPRMFVPASAIRGINVPLLKMEGEQPPEEVPKRLRSTLEAFQDVSDIPGLSYVDEFISLTEEKLLVEFVDSMPWNRDLKRRTQQYGFKYNYRVRDSVQKTVPIPKEFEFLIDRLMQNNLLQERPDQVIVNEYVIGQGISAHVDNPYLFKDGIVSVSLNSPAYMNFTSREDSSIKKAVQLGRRSAIILKGPARYEWMHSIPMRASDYGVFRTRRVSLTFRKVK